VGRLTSSLEGEEEFYGTESVDGFNFKALQQGATARIGAYFKGYLGEGEDPALFGGVVGSVGNLQGTGLSGTGSVW
jgi:hypothetical protein